MIWDFELMKNRYVYSDIIQQIEEYYKKKGKEIFEDDIFYDGCGIGLGYPHAIPRKWYEITLLKTFPFQKMKITRDIPKEEFIIDADAPIFTTGVIVDSGDVAAFLKGTNNYIGIDEKNNYYEVYLVSSEYFLYEGNSWIYECNKELEFFMEKNNSDLLRKIKTTPKTDSKKEELVFEIWEYIYPMLTYLPDSSSMFTYYELKGTWFRVESDEYCNDYENFHIGCKAYEKLLAFVEHEERFKEEKVVLHGQVCRPIKRKNHS